MAIRMTERRVSYAVMIGASALLLQDDDEVYGPDGRSRWLDVDWREHQRWITVEDQRLNVIELGEGPPLVFLHGLVGRWAHWLEQLPLFATEHRVIAIDLPGFGESPLPTSERISVSLYARLLERLLDHLQIDAAAVVGHSMGGFTAIELAINFPQRVERLLLVSPAGLSTYNDPRSLRALSLLRRIEPFAVVYNAWVARHADLFARRPRLRLLDPVTSIVTRHPDRMSAPFIWEWIRGSDNPGFADGLEANLDYDYSERLPEVACPTLIVWGDRDRVVSPGDADLYEQLIPNARKVVFQDTGHMAMAERPDRFNALLEGFLRE
jgi:pimeloyl-ACP methyl ester carboxylesterase